MNFEGRHSLVKIVKVTKIPHGPVICEAKYKMEGDKKFIGSTDIFEDNLLKNFSVHTIGGEIEVLTNRLRSIE